LLWVGISKPFPLTPPVQKTKVVNNRTNPVWNEDFYFCITNQTALFVDVLDSNDPPDNPDNFVCIKLLKVCDR
jgi:Ca2+-dependent lipid-binding protein